MHISELSHEEKGLSCKCTCIECGRRLIARFCNDKVNHFAHERQSECSGGDRDSNTFVCKGNTK